LGSEGADSFPDKDTNISLYGTELPDVMRIAIFGSASGKGIIGEIFA
jgi:hypothetical protein